jgi:hypothetical protein
MTFIRDALLVYPQLSEIIRGAERIPLSTRSLLIKQCQAQHNFRPIDPRSYPFLYMSPPLAVYVSLYTFSFEFYERGFEPCISDDLCFEGDEVTCNSDQRLVLLERLGYLSRSHIVSLLIGSEAQSMHLAVVQNPKSLPPSLYKYRVIKDIPSQFIC